MSLPLTRWSEGTTAEIVEGHTLSANKSIERDVVKAADGLPGNGDGGRWTKRETRMRKTRWFKSAGPVLMLCFIAGCLTTEMSSPVPSVYRLPSGTSEATEQTASLEVGERCWITSWNGKRPQDIDPQWSGRLLPGDKLMLTPSKHNIHYSMSNRSMKMTITPTPKHEYILTFTTDRSVVVLYDKTIKSGVPGSYQMF